MNKTGIEWCDMTWNPITGCTPISEGCENCYAKRITETRLRGRFGYPKENPFKPGCEHFERYKQPGQIRKPKRIFTCSMGDLFHDDVPPETLHYIFDQVIPQANHHTYLFLTKRPEILKNFLLGYEDWDYPENLWFGVSVENQARAEGRIPLLLQARAKVRFVSIEPLLGPVDLWKRTSEIRYKPKYGASRPVRFIELIDWVIVGAETGPGARPYQREWVQDIIYQCREANVPLFLKDNLRWPEIIQEFPKGR